MPDNIVLWIGINAGAWLAIHLGVAWLGTQAPARWFCPDAWPFRIRSWEQDGHLYERGMRVKLWKDWIPDGAALFAGGFPKADLGAAAPERLARFLRETCRGEAVHWVAGLAAFLFFAWNPPWAGWLMVAYGAAANLPCIIVQRYNRPRLARLLAARVARPSGGRRLAPSEPSVPRGRA